MLVTPHDEQQLIAMARAGEVTAFDALLRQHAAAVYRLALRMLGHPEDAEDVQQETFILAYRQLRAFRGEASFATWLYAIAARLCLSRRRRNDRRSTTCGVEELLLAGPAREEPEQRQLLRFDRGNGGIDRRRHARGAASAM